MATMTSRVQPIYSPANARTETVAPAARPVRVVRFAPVHAILPISAALCAAVMLSVYLGGLMMQYQANYQRVALANEIASLRQRNQELRLVRDAAKQAADAEDWAIAHGMIRNARALVLREGTR